MSSAHYEETIERLTKTISDQRNIIKEQRGEIKDLRDRCVHVDVSLRRQRGEYEREEAARAQKLRERVLIQSAKLVDAKEVIDELRMLDPIARLMGVNLRNGVFVPEEPLTEVPPAVEETLKALLKQCGLFGEMARKAEGRARLDDVLRICTALALFSYHTFLHLGYDPLPFMLALTKGEIAGEGDDRILELIDAQSEGNNVVDLGNKGFMAEARELFKRLRSAADAMGAEDAEA